MELGFTKSEINECVFYKGSVMYILYTYESTITGPNQEELDTVVSDLVLRRLTPLAGTVGVKNVVTN